LFIFLFKAALTTLTLPLDKSPRLLVVCLSVENDAHVDARTAPNEDTEEETEEPPTTAGCANARRRSVETPRREDDMMYQ